jgi:hypothetical protein
MLPDFRLICMELILAVKSTLMTYTMITRRQRPQLGVRKITSPMTNQAYGMQLRHSGSSRSDGSVEKVEIAILPEPSDGTLEKVPLIVGRSGYQMGVTLVKGTTKKQIFSQSTSFIQRNRFSSARGTIYQRKTSL